MIDNSAGQTILEAYRNSQNAQYQQDQLAQQKEEADNMLQFHRDQLKELHEYHQSTLKQALASAQLDASDAYNMLHGPQDVPLNNLPQPNPQSTLSPGQNGQPNLGISDPGASQIQPYKVNFDPSDPMSTLFPGGMMTDPNYQKRRLDLQTKLADLAGYKAQKISEGQAPSKEELQSQKDEAAAARAHDTNQTRMLIASGQESSKELIAAMKQGDSANEEGAIQQGLETLRNGGDINTLRLPQQTKLKLLARAQQENLSAGYDAKQVGKTLGNAQALDDVLNEGEKFANRFSRDSPDGGVAAIMKGGVGVGAMHAAQLALKDKEGQVITTLEGSTRKQEVDVMRQLLGNGGNPLLTKEQNLENTQKAHILASKIFQGSFHGMTPTQSSELLKRNNLGDYAPGGKYYDNSKNGLVTLVAPNGTDKIVLSPQDPRYQKYIDAGAKPQ